MLIFHSFNRTSFSNITTLITVISIVLFFISCDRREDAKREADSTKTEILPPNNLDLYYPCKLDDTLIIAHKFYHLSYNENLEQPNWVVYKLTKQMLNNASVIRSNNFREDNSVSSGSAIKENYAGSGYDRGHLVPAGDMKFSKEAMSETFYLSNMSPQIPDFNRGIWSKLERKVRKWALQENSLIVIVGPVSDSCITWIGADSVCVPYQYYKVILDIAPPHYKGIAFIMRNDNVTNSVFNYSTTIDSVENLTGIDFFSYVEMVNIDSIESTINDSIWR